MEQDLKLLSRCSPPDENLSFSGLRVERGSLEKEGTRAVRETIQLTDWVFLQIPSAPGFLLQISNDGRLSLERATRARPQVIDFSGTVVSRTIFVSQKECLDDLSVLDESTVRTSQGRTLSVSQFSEMLIALAFEQIESSLTEWVRN